MDSISTIAYSPHGNSAKQPTSHLEVSYRCTGYNHAPFKTNIDYWRTTASIDRSIDRKPGLSLHSPSTIFTPTISPLPAASIASPSHPHSRILIQHPNQTNLRQQQQQIHLHTGATDSIKKKKRTISKRRQEKIEKGEEEEEEEGSYSYLILSFPPMNTEYKRRSCSRKQKLFCSIRVPPCTA